MFDLVFFLCFVIGWDKFFYASGRYEREVPKPQAAVWSGSLCPGSLCPSVQEEEDGLQHTCQRQRATGTDPNETYLAAMTRGGGRAVPAVTESA